MVTNCQPTSDDTSAHSHLQKLTEGNHTTATTVCSNVLTPPFQNTATYVAGDSAKHHHHICHQHAHAIAPVLCSAIPSNIVCPNAKQIFQTGSAPHFHNILEHTSISTSQNIPDQDLDIPWSLDTTSNPLWHTQKLQPLADIYKNVPMHAVLTS